jgi:hypothetical protein
MIVTCLVHRLDLNLPQTDGIGRCRAGHARKQQAGQDIGITEPPTDRAKQNCNKIEQALCDSTGVH